MKIKNVHIRNAHIVARPLEPVSGYLFNATSITNWAGVTASGSPALRESKYLEFTGTQSLTTDGIQISTLTNNDYTYEFWLRTAPGNGGALLTKYGTGGYTVSAVELDTTTLMLVGYWAEPQAYRVVPTHITRDVWQHYTVTYSTATGYLKTYYNGQLVDTTTMAPEVAPRNYGNNPMFFELFAYSPTSFGNGGALTADFGEFRLYTRALSASEVNQNFLATAPRWGINPA
jgi:hypothetical protein